MQPLFLSFLQHSLTHETSAAGNSLNLVFQLVYETRPLLNIGNLYVTFSPLRKYSLIPYRHSWLAAIYSVSVRNHYYCKDLHMAFD